MSKKQGWRHSLIKSTEIGRVCLFDRRFWDWEDGILKRHILKASESYSWHLPRIRMWSGRKKIQTKALSISWETELWEVSYPCVWIMHCLMGRVMWDGKWNVWCQVCRHIKEGGCKYCVPAMTMRTNQVQSMIWTPGSETHPEYT